MGPQEPEEKKPEDKGAAGQSGTPPHREAALEDPVEPRTEPIAGDPLASRTGPVAGEVPAGLERVEPEPVEAEPARPASAEPPRAGSPWTGAEAAGPERPDAAVAPPPSPLPAHPAERKGGAGRAFLAGILASLLILALAGAAGYLTRGLWAPRLVAAGAGAAAVAPATQAADTGDAQGTAASLQAETEALKAEVAELRTQLGARDERLSAAETRLDGLGKQVEQVAAAPAQAAAAPQPPVPDLSQPVAELDQRLVRLEGDIQRLTGMEQGLAGVQSAMSEVRSEVQTAVDKAEQQASRPVATVLAINQLADALGRSDGYARQLEALRVIVGQNAGLAEPMDRLAAWSASGLATLGQLQGEFPSVGQKVAQSDYQSGGEGWLDDVTNRLTSLVTVRKVGDAALASGGTDAALAQAQAALAGGDLAGAVKALEGLQGAAAEAASPWLAKARDRVAAEKALADLRLAAIAQLDAARG